MLRSTIPMLLIMALLKPLQANDTWQQEVGRRLDGEEGSWDAGTGAEQGPCPGLQSGATPAACCSAASSSSPAPARELHSQFGPLEPAPLT